MLKTLYPEIKVLILTTFNDTEYIIEALNYGAVGYILKDIEGDELIKAINDDAYKGSLMLPSSVARKLAEKLSGSKPVVAYIVTIVIAFVIVIDMCRKASNKVIEICLT